MGWKFEVEAWQFHKGTGSYKYLPVYHGNNVFKAFWAMSAAKKESGCVKLMWR